MSQVITFYSYKGGVGRSLALVNVATLLSKWGKKVLMIDWDLEAPGLENFFAPYLQDVDWGKQKGVLDFLWAKQKKQPAPWQDWAIPFSTKVSTVPLHLLVSGKSNGDYSDQLRAFNVSQFYKKHDGARVIEDFRKELLAAYDYILIDSRTGVTDFGGICTIQMPDILVMLLTATEQGLNGTAKIAEKAQAAHAALPFDREKLLIMPVPSRIDQSEYALTQEWLNKIATKLKPYYEDWIPAQIDVQEFMRLIKLPYIPYFSYGEKLPVIEQGVSDPAGLGYAYENLAMLVGRRLDSVDEFMEKREKYLEETSGVETLATIQDMGELPIDITVAIFSFQEQIREEIKKVFNIPGIRFSDIESIKAILGMDIWKLSTKWVANISQGVKSADLTLFVVDQKFIDVFSILDKFERDKIYTRIGDDAMIVPIYTQPEFMGASPSFLVHKFGEILINGHFTSEQISRLKTTIMYVSKEKWGQQPAAEPTGGPTN